MTTDRVSAAERIDDFGHVREDVGELTAALDRLVGLKRSLVSRWDR